MKTNNKGFTIVETLIVVSVLAGIGGVGYFVYNRQDTKSSISSVDSSETKESTLPTNLEGVLSLTKVEELVKQESSTATIKGIKLEVEDGVLVFVVYMSDGSKLAFNATSGEKVAVSSDSNDAEESFDYVSGFDTKLTLSKAIEIAQVKRPGIAIKKVEIEIEDGVLVYSVRFVDKGRVDIDAENGSVIELREKDDKEVKARDKKQNDDDQDDDGQKNEVDKDDDNDKIEDTKDEDDDNDGVSGSDDKDDDNDDVDDKDDEDKDEDKDEDNSGSSDSNED